MESQAPFAYARSGAVLVGADVHEIVAYSGSDDAPLWLRRAGSQIAGLGATSDQVVAVDASSRLQRWGLDGQPLEQAVLTEFGGGPSGRPRAFAVSPSGLCAFTVDDRVIVSRPGRPVVSLKTKGPATVALSSDDAFVLVGMSDGQLDLLDPAGTRLAHTSVDGAVTGLAWNPRGAWVITTSTAMHLWDGHLPPVRAFLSPDTALASPTCSARGGLVACRTGRHDVQVFAVDTGRTIGRVRTIDRPIGVIEFGPALWLAIGLDHADGNRVDLRTGAVHRTDTHPDKNRSSWRIEVDLDSAAAIEAETARTTRPLRVSEPPMPRSSKILALVAAGAIVAGVVLIAVFG